MSSLSEDRNELPIMKKYVFATAMLYYMLGQQKNDNVRRLYTHRQRRLSNIRSSSAKKRVFKERQSWESFQTQLSDRQFRRYFRMSRDCFDQLCKRIEKNVGQSTFKSEQYLLQLCKGSIDQRKQRKMNHAHGKSTGGFVSGEVKLALTLRLLAGGTYMDLALLYEVGMTYAYEILHEVVYNWINDERFITINGEDYLNDDKRMATVANDFATRSQNLFKGAIGALDGWLVKVKRPTKLRDKVSKHRQIYSYVNSDDSSMATLTIFVPVSVIYRCY